MKLLKFLFAVGTLALLLTIACTPTDAGSLQLKVFADAQARHPDIWAGCQTECIQARLEAAPFLKGLAVQANVNLDDLTRYAVVRSFEWGQSFENLYGHPPTDFDWIYSYADNAEAIRYEVAASPVIFARNDWATKHSYRLNKAYGGPY